MVQKTVIGLRQLLHRRAHFRKRLDRREAGARFNARIARRHAHAIPFFFGGIFGGQEEYFARAVEPIAAGECPVLRPVFGAGRMISPAPSSLWPVR